MRGHPPKDIRERREAPPRQEKPEVAPKKSRWLDPLNLALGIGGFVLTVIALALALKAGPTVSLQPPLNAVDVLTTPIEITNTGLLDLENVRFRSFEIDVNDAHDHHRINNLSMNSHASPSTIGTGQTQTIPFQQTLADPNVPIVNADVIVVVLFTPQYMPFWSKREAFRLKTATKSDGTVVLQKQPIGNALELYDKFAIPMSKAHPELLLN